MEKLTKNEVLTGLFLGAIIGLCFLMMLMSIPDPRPTIAARPAMEVTRR